MGILAAASIFKSHLPFKVARECRVKQFEMLDDFHRFAIDQRRRAGGQFFIFLF